jgi:hypothetical protein
LEGLKDNPPLSDDSIYIPRRYIEAEKVSQLNTAKNISTRSGQYRQEQRFSSFTLPTSVDQTGVAQVLKLAKELFFPPLFESDVQGLEFLLDLLDRVLFKAMQDPDNWVLPKEFSQIPYVQQSLSSGMPIDKLLGRVLESLRIFIWIYLEDLASYVPPLSELEDAFALLMEEQNPSSVVNPPTVVLP